MAKKKTKNPYEHAFGSSEYLACKFSDIDTAVESRKSKTAKEVKKLVESLKTDKDQMHVFKVYKVTGRGSEGRRDGYVVHVAMGLNGPGRGSDYAAAVKRLLDTGRFFLFDAWIDAIDDLWGVLLNVKGE